MMGKGSLRMVYRSAAVQRVDDIVANRLRVVADNIKAFAQIQILNHIVNDQGFGRQADGGEQSCLRPEYEE